MKEIEKLQLMNRRLIRKEKAINKLQIKKNKNESNVQITCALIIILIFLSLLIMLSISLINGINAKLFFSTIFMSSFICLILMVGIMYWNNKIDNKISKKINSINDKCTIKKIDLKITNNDDLEKYENELKLMTDEEINKIPECIINEIVTAQTKKIKNNNSNIEKLKLLNRKEDKIEILNN